MGQVFFFRTLRFSPINIIPPTFQTCISIIYHHLYIIFVIHSFDRPNTVLLVSTCFSYPFVFLRSDVGSHVKTCKCLNWVSVQLFDGNRSYCCCLFCFVCTDIFLCRASTITQQLHSNEFTITLQL